MTPNPLLGVVFHWLGGLASGSFYVPYKGVRRWSWETYWLVGGVFSWLVCPWLLASLLTNNLFGVLSQQSASTLGWTYFFGAMWGLGGLTFGLTMRYLGMSLGMGVALGYCAAFGTLVPPLFKSLMPSIPVAASLGDIASTVPGQITLLGVGVCLLGILVSARAGLAKEKAMDADAKKAAVAEFSYSKGIAVATFSGIMSACFAFALTAAAPISDASLAAGTPAMWTGLPKLVVVLLGGFTTNFLWCAYLHLRNRSAREYVGACARDAGGAVDAHGNAVTDSKSPRGAETGRAPLLRNYGFSALAGSVWYFQFFFYTMGETQMGKFGFASWTLHMASIIIFSTLWGLQFKEWTGAGQKAHRLIGLGIATLIVATMVIGLGTYLKDHS